MRGAGEQAFSACSIGYIHGLICDSITLFHSDACNAKALRNESMILEVLEAEEPAVFRQELFNTLVHYYEEIQGLHGACGRPKPKSFKHKMKSAQPRAAAAAAAGGDSAEDAADEPPAPPPLVEGGGWSRTTSCGSSDRPRRTGGRKAWQGWYQGLVNKAA